MFRALAVPFLLSRGLILVCALVIAPVLSRPDAGRVPLLRLDEWPTAIHQTLFVADSYWYRTIAQRGYTPGSFASFEPISPARQASWAFFPAYPILVRAVATVIPLGLDWTGILLSNLALVAGLVVLTQIVRAEWNERVAVLTGWLLLCFPSSYDLSGFRPESLLLLATLVSVDQARRGRWWVAGVAGAVASAARPLGALVIVLLVAEWLRQPAKSRSPYGIAGAIGLTLAGIGAFMGYLWLTTGNPLAFVGILGAWDRGTGLPGAGLFHYIAEPYLIGHDGWSFGPTDFLLPIVALGAGLSLLARRQYGYGLYALLGILLPLSTTTISAGGRHAIVLFPIFIALALLLEKQSEAWRTSVITISAAVLTLLSLLVALGVRGPAA